MPTASRGSPRSHASTSPRERLRVGRRSRRSRPFRLEGPRRLDTGAVPLTDEPIDPAALEDEALAAIRSAATQAALDEARVRYLGRNGRVTALLRGLGALPPEARAEAGQAANELKRTLTAALETRREELDRTSGDGARAIDVTLPGHEPPSGGRHVLREISEEIREIFQGMGFSVALGPDVEDEYHNFEALNIPRGHPAREMHDTFFLSDDLVLRTHTSPVQIRLMESQAPPVRAIFPGRVYRNETVDASHGAEFWQCEILYVDEGVSLRDLKGCLHTFTRQLFGDDVRVRFRPSYFPFTEPSAELDIACLLCRGQGCPACKQSGWVELLGCGMVHPRVFEFVGYDTERYTGYAAGVGIERVAMMRHRIPDIRYFTTNDVRFLAQF